jgi:hypothetical protein
MTKIKYCHLIFVIFDFYKTIGALPQQSTLRDLHSKCNLSQSHSVSHVIQIQILYKGGLQMILMRYAILGVLSTSLLLVGCSKNEGTPPEISTIPVVSTPQGVILPAMQGTVTVNKGVTETKVTYTFTNQTKEKITVIGGAKYTLLKDNTLFEQGAVAIKDYLDLEPGQSYTDSKTFMNLPKGDYHVEVMWNKTKVTATFNRS